MSGKKFAQVLIIGLLILKVLLIGVQAKNYIQQGDSPIDVLLWVINKSVPILQYTSRQQKKNKDKHK